jgi:hypothetical protein
MGSCGLNKKSRYVKMKKPASDIVACIWNNNSNSAGAFTGLREDEISPFRCKNYNIFR